MKKWKLFCVQACLFFLGGMMGGSCTSSTPASPDYASWVDPFIGTGGHGHTYPGAVVPHGMIQPSPDTRIDGWDSCSGYYYADSTMNGFSHTHLSGTGCCDYGDVLLMPTVGPQDCRQLGTDSQQMAYASAFSHASEQAEPGYYTVFLDRYGVKAELTATERAALHRYTFPASDAAGFILDMEYSLQRQRNLHIDLRVLNDSVICGGKTTGYWAFEQSVYFYAVFSKPFTAQIERGAVALLHFDTKPDEQVSVKIGISAVDVDGARRNVETEIPAWDFEGVRQAARQAWNRYLAKIDIETDDEEARKIFYTSLYHTGLQPNLLTDVDGRYLGMDLQAHAGDVNDPVYTVFSLWDTFRAYHPLMTIIDPDLNQAFIRSLLLKHREGGIFPMWELGGNYTGTMIGYHAASLIADAYTKGYRDFDVEEAYRACMRAAEYDTAGIRTARALRNCLMPPAKYWKNKVGYVPCDKDKESVAKALEYAYDDWCISVLAEAMGDRENQAKYAKLAKAYATYYDPATGFMRGLDSHGQWRTPFHPRASNHRNDDYCEGNAWQWTWFVPHDVEGLVEKMGGQEAFITKLDSLFTIDSALEGSAVSVDISGLIGQYAHGNEPSHHITHLYNYVGQPWRTQELVDEVLHTLYSAQPDGLSGNEDCGQMSAWYILNAMGFYQVCPGKPVYSIGRPLFHRSVVHLKDGQSFTIVVHNNSRPNKYIQQMKLNGKVLEAPFFTHNDIVAGSTLEITMGPQPVKSYSSSHSSQTGK